MIIIIMVGRGHVEIRTDRENNNNTKPTGGLPQPAKLVSPRLDKVVVVDLSRRRRPSRPSCFHCILKMQK